MYRLLRPWLFRLAPETAQRVALAGLEAARWLPMPAVPGTPVRLMGLTFPNRVGLAAGFDKSAAHVDALARLGFGFIEVGTVTPRPQAGNPPPTIFRLVEDQALINRMGFPSEGAAAAARNLARRRSKVICGVNIGKNRDTPVADAARDYVACLEMLYPLADYVTLNVSSPNTAGLRDLQQTQALRALLAEVTGARERLSGVHGRRVPLLVKLAPDLDAGQLEAVARELAAVPVDGVIATNTTTQRPAQLRSAAQREQGGLSGAPLTPLSLACVSALRRLLPAQIPLIGVGGVMSAVDGAELREAGADLLQVFTGLIYRGPGLVRALLALER
jgi:dihydroorotate dehydrogenase